MRTLHRVALGIALVFGFVFFALAEPAQAPAGATLKDTFEGAFYVGVAVSSNQITGADSEGDALIAQQFDSITPENAMNGRLFIRGLMPMIFRWLTSMSNSGSSTTCSSLGIIFAGTRRRRGGF